MAQHTALCKSESASGKETKHFIGFSSGACVNRLAIGLQTDSGGNTLQFLFVFQYSPTIREVLGSSHPDSTSFVLFLPFCFSFTYLDFHAITITTLRQLDPDTLSVKFWVSLNCKIQRFNLPRHIVELCWYFRADFVATASDEKPTVATKASSYTTRRHNQLDYVLLSPLFPFSAVLYSSWRLGVLLMLGSTQHSETLIHLPS